MARFVLTRGNADRRGRGGHSRTTKDECAEDIETFFTILYYKRFLRRLRRRTAVQEERYLHIVQAPRV